MTIEINLLKDEGGREYYQDQDGNKCYVAYFGSHTAAFEGLKDLEGCKNCINYRLDNKISDHKKDFIEIDGGFIHKKFLEPDYQLKSITRDNPHREDGATKWEYDYEASIELEDGDSVNFAISEELVKKIEELCVDFYKNNSEKIK